MRKVVKFGGSSLANAEQFEKVGDIIRSEESRRFVVPSAPGKRFDGDTKVTDLLYSCYDAAANGGDFEKVLEEIKSRYYEIIKGLGLALSMEEDFQLIREMDFDLRVALIATVMVDGREVVIASSSFSVFGQDEAEVAFIVEEDYHRLGIARRLLTHLGKIATAAGIRTFIAEVLPHNTAMLGVFGRCGWPMTTHSADGVIHITLELNPADQQP